MAMGYPYNEYLMTIQAIPHGRLLVPKNTTRMYFFESTAIIPSTQSRSENISKGNAVDFEVHQ